MTPFVAAEIENISPSGGETPHQLLTCAMVAAIEAIRKIWPEIVGPLHDPSRTEAAYEHAVLIGSQAALRFIVPLTSYWRVQGDVTTGIGHQALAVLAHEQNVLGVFRSQGTAAAVPPVLN